MNSDKALVSERFPRSAKYHPKWVLASVNGAANALPTEWAAATELLGAVSQVTVASAGHNLLDRHLQHFVTVALP